ncbi:MAG: glutamate racemase [Myxococcota bacterium]
MLAVSYMDKRFIAVLDSGVGGLHVLDHLHRALPGESTLYLADTARLPYGSKSRATVLSYARQAARFLCKQRALKLLVVACNTASAAALSQLQQELPIPVVGTVTATAQAACVSHPRHIAVLATTQTVQWQAYVTALRQQGFAGKIYQQACPLFVSLVEEGWLDHPVTQMVAQHYLSGMPRDTDLVILGCTHYPQLQPLLMRLAPHVGVWIDSGTVMAQQVREQLAQSNDLAVQQQGQRQYLVTDSPQWFTKLANRFLRDQVNGRQVTRVDLT